MSGGDGFVGADPVRLDELAATFERSAGRLDEMLTDLRSRADDAPWVGPDADQVRQHIHGEVAPRVVRTAATLRDQAAALRRQAADQRAASAAPGGSVRSVGPVGPVGSVGPVGPGGPGGILPAPSVVGPSAGAAPAGAPASAPARGSAAFWGLPVLVPAGARVATAPPAWADPGRAADDHEIFRGAEWRGHRPGDVGGVHLEGDASARAGAGVSRSAHAGREGVALGAGADGRAWAGVEVAAAGSASYGVVTARARAAGFAGAAAGGEVDAHLGLDGARLGAGADAFAGGRAGADGSLDLAGAEGTAGGHVSYGIGASGHAGGSLTTETIGLHAEMGLTFGLGADAHLDVEVHPAEVAGHLRDGADAFFHVVNPFD